MNIRRQLKKFARELLSGCGFNPIEPGRINIYSLVYVS